MQMWEPTRGHHHRQVGCLGGVLEGETANGSQVGEWEELIGTSLHAGTGPVFLVISEL